ncbi:RNA polymerase factor sigma-54 [Sneathiella sp. CAU 1612]|uniref:RNA polymerase sigma-54 factor n=1 Tax=Sneathiella sedimenti TaxID=2816034 RepID=A0ABS3F1Z5_9PROT|nr:RNA polymerase factor sigma-54 [Sneathiella sedimenti]MBO0332539.1 RNA polymerase factor sigma-54 [Sneathiella sedimenti]
MALTPRLDLRQSQQLVMTPQLQQAIKLLQLSNLDLAAYVEQELEKNPLLERADSLPGEDEYPASDDGGDVDNDGDFASLEEISISEDAPLSAAENTAIDTDYDNIYTSDAPLDAPSEAIGADAANTGILSASTGGSNSFSGADLNLENTLSEDLSLRDHLDQQLNLLSLTPADRLIASYLIDMVSDAGYLVGDLEEASENLGCTTERLQSVLEILRGLEPTGVFATDLADCLALQLKEKNRYDPAIAALLENLEMLAEGNLKGLLEVCDIDQEDLAEMISEIKALDPKPGLQFGGEVAQTVVPDVFVQRRPDGGWQIELNSETLPKVLVNNRYYSVINNKSRRKEEKEYLSECLNSANWLVKSLDQRAHTILKVATALVEEQEMFFTQGIEFLRPLNLKTIAEAISMHESTVSRVTSNKYLATSRGVFELKYFFTSAINSTSGGDSHSATSVRHKLKQLIDDEAPNRILSDDKIVELMKLQGIDIARRTVAKYRDAMNIPSSVERRRMKKQLIAS